MNKVQDIINFMESLAPTTLKEDFDNVGLMVGCRDKIVNKVLLALDCTIEVIEEAKEMKSDLIITHHPLIFRKINNITSDTIQGNKIIELIKNDISVYSSHTNLDSVENGLNQRIVELLGFNKSEILEQNKKDNSAGIGRIVTLENNLKLEEVQELIKKNLNIESMRVVDSKNEIKKIAIINGSGQSYIDKAIMKGANCIITGDTTYHFASDCMELGITVIDIGHFPSEWLVFIETIKSIKEKFKDIDFVVSKKSVDPYKFVTK